jgi:hypothetical protein
LLCNKKKTEDASRARFDPLACVIHSLVEYVNPAEFTSEILEYRPVLIS